MTFDTASTVCVSSGYGLCIISATMSTSLCKERSIGAHLPTVEHGATQQTTDDVALLLLVGIHVLMNREAARADVIGNATQAAPRIGRGIVFHA